METIKLLILNIEIKSLNLTIESLKAQLITYDDKCIKQEQLIQLYKEMSVNPDSDLDTKKSVKRSREVGYSLKITINLI